MQSNINTTGSYFNFITEFLLGYFGCLSIDCSGEKHFESLYFYQLQMALTEDLLAFIGYFCTTCL